MNGIQLGKPNTKDLGIKTYFITVSPDLTRPKFFRKCKKKY